MPSSMPKSMGECIAYHAEYGRLMRNMSLCGNDPTCIAEVQAEADDVATQGGKECRKAGVPIDTHSF